MFSHRSLNLEGMKHMPSVLGSLSGIENEIMNQIVMIVIGAAKDHNIINGQ